MRLRCTFDENCGNSRSEFTSHRPDHSPGPKCLSSPFSTRCGACTHSRSVAAHQFRRVEDVAFHRSLDFLARRTARYIERYVQRIQPKEVAMLARWRLRPAVFGLVPIIKALAGVCGHMTFGDLGRLWIQIEEDPMIKRPARRIGIIDDQCQAAGI